MDKMNRFEVLAGLKIASNNGIVTTSPVGGSDITMYLKDTYQSMLLDIITDTDKVYTIPMQILYYWKKLIVRYEAGDLVLLSSEGLDVSKMIRDEVLNKVKEVYKLVEHEIEEAVSAGFTPDTALWYLEKKGTVNFYVSRGIYKVSLEVDM